MKLVVSMRTAECVDYEETRDLVSHDLIRWIEGFDCIPVPVPNGLAAAGRFADAVGPAGIVLSGGDDLGELETAAAGASLRDATEISLLEHAATHQLPVFGICRGLQMLNRFQGGALPHRLREHPSPVVQHRACDHEVRLLIPIVGHAAEEHLSVNSYHNYVVGVSALASGLEAFAVAADDTVEGVRGADGRDIAVTWHPERPSASADFDRSLFERWLSQCG